ncbi:Hypothetical_protein [Hexamita inflata]|uniref:Hypothetical_protein n=1 Tax=Hexamita inflata TaxID=28002 RepID=A0AA86UII4_9EUKA|nr:Hypothetical protein HINF_LOCUS44819 [Hexamita inflata]
MNQNEQNINYLKQIQQYICERALHDRIVVKAKELLMLFQTAKIEEKTKIEEEFMDIVVSSNALQLYRLRLNHRLLQIVILRQTIVITAHRDKYYYWFPTCCFLLLRNKFVRQIVELTNIQLVDTMLRTVQRRRSWW